MRVTFTMLRGLAWFVLNLPACLVWGAFNGVCFGLIGLIDAHRRMWREP